MSAFIVDKVHIDVLIRAGLNARYKPMAWYYGDKSSQLTYENVDEVGQMLLDECVLSVSSRYDDDKPTTLPGPNDAYWLIPYQYRERPIVPPPVVMLCIVRCYMYQSNEHPEWKISEAKAYCDALMDDLINKLPGYSDAPWGWTEEEDAKLNGKMVRLV